MAQVESFLSAEADLYDERNAANTKIKNSTKFLISKLKDENVSLIYEVGCGRGYQLEHLCEQLKAKGKGTDPSAKAVEAATTHAKEKGLPCEYYVGTSGKLEAEDASVDLVHFGFVLYLVPDEVFEQTLDECFRILKPGGLISIEDFDADTEYKNSYMNKEGLYAYKRNYVRILGDDKYACKLLFKDSYRDSGEAVIEKRGDRRIAVQIFMKLGQENVAGA